LPNGNDTDNNHFRTSWYGPIRVNGDLMWTGLNTIVVNGMENLDFENLKSYYPMTIRDNNGGITNLVGVSRDDTVDVAGRIFHDALPDGLPANTQTHLTAMDPYGAPKQMDLEPTV